MKKLLRYVLYFFLLTLLFFNIYIVCSGKIFIYKALAYNFVNIDDYKIFANTTIPKSTKPQPWPVSSNYNIVPVSDTVYKTLTSLESVAYLVIKNDSIVTEQYWDEYGKNSLSNSFSMAKSVISMLVGVAVKERKIKSVDQSVADFLPEFREGEKAKITIRHLLTMSSGLDWDESKSYRNAVSVFFSDIMEGYYGTDLYKLVVSIPVAYPAGVYFDYKSGDTQLLSFVLERATGETVSKYFYERIWNHVGAENEALWCLDRPDGNEKAFCCLNSNARDFARLGKLYLNNGTWNNVSLVDSAYIKASLTGEGLPDKNNPSDLVNFYGYQWWLLPGYKGQNIFYMRGSLGQMVIVIPEKKIIIVRLGNKQGPKSGSHYAQTLLYIDEVNKAFP